MDWDSEDYVPPTTVVAAIEVDNKWEGEDEEEPTKLNWDDDEEEKKREEKAKKKEASAASKKPASKLAQKIEEIERKEREKNEKKMQQKLEDDIDIENMTPEQVLAEKERRRKLQEEADLEFTKETFGVTDDEVNKLKPRTKEDFVTLRENLTRKILDYKSTTHFPLFIEEFFRDVSAGLSIDDLRKVKMNMENMYNEKVRAEKETKKKGKGKSAKAKLRMDDKELIIDEYSGYTRNDYDDYDDFM